jgi:hypothetical protein
VFNGVFGRFLPQIRENIVQYKLYIHAFLRYTYLFGRNVGYSWEYIGINVAPPLLVKLPFPPQQNREAEVLLKRLYM